MDLQTTLKRKAARHAVSFIGSGMIVGLGTGSTSRFAIERLGECLREGQLADITGIPSSLQTEKLAQRVSIPLADFSDHAAIDITIDGADEVDSDLNLIKGGGGALLREKVLAQNSRRNIIIVDESKISAHLGQKWAVPVEVIPFARRCVENFLKALGASVSVRKTIDGTPFWTDQHNQVLDADFGVIEAPHRLAARLSARAGVVDHGLFLDLAGDVIVAEPDRIRHLQRGDQKVSETIIPDP